MFLFLSVDSSSTYCAAKTLNLNVTSWYLWFDLYFLVQIIYNVIRKHLDSQLKLTRGRVTHFIYAFVGDKKDTVNSKPKKKQRLKQKVAGEHIYAFVSDIEDDIQEQRRSSYKDIFMKSFTKYLNFCF